MAKPTKGTKHSITDLEVEDMGTAKVRKVFSALQEKLEKMKVDDKLGIPGIGIFKKVKTKPRKGRNPFNGETINVPAKVKVRFSAASNMRDM